MSDAHPDYTYLAHLHDSRLLELTWDCRNSSRRNLRLELVGDPETEYVPWRGKNLTIVLTDVVALTFIGWGYGLGEESLNSWRLRISDSLEKECRDLGAAGVSLPSLRFTITFHSGSTLELVCSEVSVSVREEGVE
jgi:hypothetical protein